MNCQPQLNMLIISLLIFLCHCTNCWSSSDDFVDIPADHVPYYFNQFPEKSQQCKEDVNCKYHKTLLRTETQQMCWGYEQKCNQSNSFSLPKCETEEDDLRRETFYRQADFGMNKYINIVTEKKNFIISLCIRILKRSTNRTDDYVHTSVSH